MPRILNSTGFIGWRNGSVTIVSRFLRFCDKEPVLKCGRKLENNTGSTKTELRKAQMNKLKKARQYWKRANFSKSKPDKLYIGRNMSKLFEEIIA